MSALRESARDDEEITSLTEKADASIASADRLLRSLLDISKLDAGGVRADVTVFPIQSVFDELTNEFAVAASDKGLVFTSMPTSVWIESDRGLLFSALQNIVANAVRYTDEGRILLGARRSGQNVDICVLDTGRGIPDAQQETVFLEFKRLDRDKTIGGAGLGLAMVERIAQLLRIDISLKSIDGRGTQFALRVKRAEAIATAAASPIAASNLDAIAGLSVLCVDNDDAVREAAEALLTRWGCHPVCVPSAEQALVAIDRNHAQPDLLLLDYQLDDGLTGFEALQSIERALGYRPATLMITASMSAEMKQMANQAGVPVLSKPVEPAQLRAFINRLSRPAAE